MELPTTLAGDPGVEDFDWRGCDWLSRILTGGTGGDSNRDWAVSQDHTPLILRLPLRLSQERASTSRSSEGADAARILDSAHVSRSGCRCSARHSSSGVSSNSSDAGPRQLQRQSSRGMSEKMGWMLRLPISWSESWTACGCCLGCGTWLVSRTYSTVPCAIVRDEKGAGLFGASLSRRRSWYAGEAAQSANAPPEHRGRQDHLAGARARRPPCAHRRR